MSRSSSSRSSRSASGRVWRAVLLALLILVAYWYQQKFESGDTSGRTDPPPATVHAPDEPAAPRSQPDPAPAAGENVDRPKAPKTAVAREDLPPAPKAPPKAAPAPAQKGTVAKVNGYDRLEGCRLVEHRDNDGDSFHIRHGSRDIELRLYYVDTPEKYLSDRYEDQRRRVAEQGRDFGGISPEQTVQVGLAAKMYTAKLLADRPFTVYTKWESVYDSERVYAFVELPDDDGGYLCEELVEKGLARIHTKGEATPDGRGYRQYKAHLEAIERAAQDADRGAWKLN